MTAFWKSSAARWLACLLILGVYTAMIDLKGISTDEGLRLWIVNGGHPFGQQGAPAPAGWTEVLDAGRPFAHSPLFFLLLNTLMRGAHSEHVLFLRSVNIFFLGVCLLGLIGLTRAWRPGPRLFLLGLFSGNAFLFMHVLQIREYILGLAFSIGTTWLVLRLDTRRLERPWADAAWFSGYGILLALGFFAQSWFVLPAAAQGLFLALRRRPDWLRFHSLLASSYVIAIALIGPYLQAHGQTVSVGRWGTEGAPLGSQLADGLHLVLAGHLAHSSAFAEFLCWFWLAVIAGTAALLALRRPLELAGLAVPEFRREGLLMFLCIGVCLAFQVGYFFRVDTLSVWPRYFLIHYFFATWLVAAGFNFLAELGQSPAAPAGLRRGARWATAGLTLVLVLSAVFQARSYRRDPYLDTGCSSTSNWRVLAAELARILEPGDIVLTRDFVHRATLTYTQPLAARVLIVPELPAADVSRAGRIVYLEPGAYPAERAGLAAQLQAAGFVRLQPVPIRATADGAVLTDWQFLVFSRSPARLP